MAMLYINTRSKKLLNILLRQTDYISLNALAQELSISRRTVYYDINKINLWLEQSELPSLEIVREKGIFIPYKERENIQAMLALDSEEQVYIFSPSERCKGIICSIICSEETIYLEEFMQYFEVSRNTIFGNLKTVTSQLSKYNLVLDYQPKTGYRILGDPVRIRAIFLLYFNEMISLFKGGAFRFFIVEKVQEYYDKLKKIEEKLGVNYVDGILFSLAAIIPVLYRHEQAVIFPGLKASKIQETKEYLLVNQYFSDMPVEEQMYLSLHLLGSRVNTVPTQFFANPSKAYIHDLAKELIIAFEKTACVTFENKEGLERALFVHLSTSLYRYQYGIQIGNPLGDDVIKEYPELFSITRTITKKLEDTIGIPIPDGEVAYLALHFGGSLKIAGKDDKKLKILIVCVNGISTGNMIKREVQKLLPFADIIDVRAVVGLNNVQDICDIIISTVPVNSVIPNIVVHPVLTELDRKNILNHRLIAPKQIAIKKNELFQVVKKYVKPDMYDNLLKDLGAYLQGDTVGLHIEDKVELDLCKLLDSSRIKTISQKYMWQESIRLTGKSLVECGSVENTYLERIISQLQYYGPYMFLTENVILAHAKPEDGVNSLDIALAVFKEPVVFSEHRKANLVIVLAAEDQEKHLKILQDILQIISDEETVSQLIQPSSPERVLAVIKEKLSDSDSIQ